jgi:hypothetical protein
MEGRREEGNLKMPKQQGKGLGEREIVWEREGETEGEREREIYKEGGTGNGWRGGGHVRNLIVWDNYDVHFMLNIPMT